MNFAPLNSKYKEKNVFLILLYDNDCCELVQQFISQTLKRATCSPAGKTDFHAFISQVKTCVLYMFGFHLWIWSALFKRARDQELYLCAYFVKQKNKCLILGEPEAGSTLERGKSFQQGAEARQGSQNGIPTMAEHYSGWLPSVPRWNGLPRFSVDPAFNGRSRIHLREIILLGKEGV